MGAAASRRFLTLSNIVRIIYSDEIHHAYTGWHGVGMSMAAKAVAKAAGESPDLFDVVVLVTAGEECSADIGKLQRRIGAQLGLFDVDGERRQDDDNGVDGADVDGEVARMINGSLAGRNYLLIIDNLLQAHDLGAMGIPTVSKWTRSKILITTPHPLIISRMNIQATIILLSTDDEEAWFQVHFGGVDELLAHFHDEAGDVANTLGISHEVDQIFNCFIYLCLFQQTTSTGTSMDAKELMKYYMGEELITAATTTSTQQPDKTDDLEGAFRHGEAILEEMVARYMVEDRSSSAAGGDGRKFSMNSHLWEILGGRMEGRRYLKEKLHIQLEGNMLEDDAAVRWVSLSHNKIQPSIPIKSRPRPWCAQQLTTLLLNDNCGLKKIPSTFFYQIPNLKVLDLSRTSISSFPPSLSSLIHLRFLKLQECPYINTLPPSLKHLKQLIILDLRGSPLSNGIPSEALEQKTNLRLVDLSHTSITHSLMSPLLSSLSNLNLERLLLAGCNSFMGPPLLMSTSSGHHHQLIRRLPELDISSCYEALKDVESVSLQDLPKLRALNLSHTPIARLSITRCTSLENVHLQGLTNLKSLHLSSIKIKKFPNEISKMTRLEQIHLSDVKQLREVDWEKLHWLPEKLEWDECGCCSFSRCRASASNLLLQPQGELGGGENRGGGAFISVSKADIFKGLSFSSQLWDNAFSKFRFSISPCLKQCGEKEKKTTGVVGANVDEDKRKVVARYADICSKMNHLHLPDHTLLMRRRIDFSRHLVIEGVVPVSSLFYGRGDGRRSPVETVVRRAEVLWLHENRGSVDSLSDLKVEEMVDLKECWVERCHDMEHLFPESLNKDIKGPSQKLWVSELGSLKSVYDEDNDFLSLKYLHIQCCVKLETLFHFYPTLPQLETLHIRFCCRLKSIFRGHHVVDGEHALPKLRVLRLWELPQLKHICRGSLLSLEHLRVRACPCLQQLPYLDSQKVKIKID